MYYYSSLRYNEAILQPEERRVGKNKFSNDGVMAIAGMDSTFLMEEKKNSSYYFTQEEVCNLTAVSRKC